MRKLNITESKSPLGRNSYYVQISKLELGNVVDVKWNGRWHDVYVEIVQGEYEIAAMQVERVGDMEFCTGNFFKGQKHTTAKINDGVIWMKVCEFPSGTKNKKRWIYENVGNKVVDTLKFYIYEENGKHRFLPENGEIEEGSVYIEPYVYGFTPITVKLDSRDISKKVNDGYEKVKKSFKESKMERKTMKKLNITKERFEKSNYFQRKYGKLEYVSESGKLFKTSKGKVLKFNESDDENVNAVQDAYDKYRACSTEPKVCQAIKINDDGTEEKVSIWMDRGLSIGGIAKAIRDGRLRKVLKFSESSKPKFVKESASDIANDPAYECPYCGSHDCEFEDAEEPGTTEGYFDGAKFNAQFYCNDCGETYNVTFQMNVVGVSSI